ncbi:rap guanine nucleotide exchange factor 1-like isoform X4 [Branchiostoma floridae x Branchiostoma japonicum]
MSWFCVANDPDYYSLDCYSPQGQQSTLGNKIRSGVGKGVEAIQRKITLSKSQSSLGKLHVRRKSSDEGSDGTQKPQVEKDVDKLHLSQKVVINALTYLEAVVDKNILENVPATASEVLQTVMELYSTLNSCLIKEQSSVIMSCHNQVYQSLANLIRWSDQVLLEEGEISNKEAANEVIHAVVDGVKELVQLSIERLQDKSMPRSRSTTEVSPTKAISPNGHRSSLGEIPLSPREKEIVQQTSPIARSTESLMSTSSSETSGDEPPPKPALPRDRVLINVDRHRNSSPPFMKLPPALPPKLTKPAQRTHSMPGADYMNQNSPRRKFAVVQPISRTPSNGAAYPPTNVVPPFNITPSTPSPASTTGYSVNSVFTYLGQGEVPYGTSPSSGYVVDLPSGSASSISSGSFRHSMDTLNFSEPDYDLINDQYMLEGSETSSTDGMLQATSPDPPGNTSNRSSLHDSDSTDSASTNRGSMASQDSLFGDRSPANTLDTSASAMGAADSPPKLPKKLRKHTTPHGSYDNLLQDSFLGSDGPFSHHVGSPHARTSGFSQHASLQPMPSQNALCGSRSPDPDVPPPLPMKKKHIQAYIHMFGDYSEPSPNFFYSAHQGLGYSGLEMSPYDNLSPCMETSPYDNVQYNTEQPAGSFNSAGNIFRFSHLTPEGQAGNGNVPVEAPALPPKRKHLDKDNRRHYTSHGLPSPPMYETPSRDKSISLIEPSPTSASLEDRPVTPKEVEDKADTTTKPNTLDSLDVSDKLVFKKEVGYPRKYHTMPKTKGEDGPDLRGGSMDVLIVHATGADKNDLMFYEAFLTTYRTFITPKSLIDKLLYRYNKFRHMSDNTRKRASRNAFFLLVRVVDELCIGELTEEIIQILMDLVFKLLCDGELVLAKLLRNKMLNKCDQRKQLALNNNFSPLSALSVSVKRASLFDFKGEELAEQMTLLDAEAFQKIEIPEILAWAKEQSEELSPNLTTFTEHFNKMSYWCRSCILTQPKAQDREKLVNRFIKIMKHLRRFNNFNSYLAILSALDSAPIRRLEWQKQTTDGLAEYCTLIDSTSSFRAYRAALAEAEPPCIPYLGLILQDITFVHLGNPDMLEDGIINFAKRWQQFNILDNVRRFKQVHYDFKRNEKIQTFFNNFDEYLSEEALWQMSLEIKPRGVRRKPEPKEPPPAESSS